MSTAFDTFNPSTQNAQPIYPAAMRFQQITGPQPLTRFGMSVAFGSFVGGTEQ